MGSKETTLSVNFTDGKYVKFSGDSCHEIFKVIKDGFDKNEVITIRITNEKMDYLFNPKNITCLEMRYKDDDK